MNQSIRRYKKRMLILCIMLVVVLMITGVSYAVFTSYTSQNDPNTLAASCMDLDFNGQNEINLLNTYPISEGEALEQTPYTFTIKNNCDNYIEYYVIASVISTTNKVDSKYVKVSLLGDSELNGTVINILESIPTPQSLSKYSITENYILKKGDGISKDESRTFNFRMWLDSSNKDIWTSEDVEGKDYQVKISVVGTVKTSPKDDLYVAALIDGTESSTFPTTSKYNASVECTRNGVKVDANESIVWNGSKWALTTTVTDGNVRCNVTFDAITFKSIILAKNEVKDPITVPGREMSSEDEAVLASTPDDYGTSYYFRGAVTNNYVQFANKCWRIVRIVGDGSVKLVLHNDNTANVSNPCSSENNSNTAAYAHSSSGSLLTGFYNSSGDNAYIGFMYGTAGSSDYASTHANINKSKLLNTLEIWHKANLLEYEDKLADTIWCNDKSTVTTLADGSVSVDGTGLGYGTEGTAYGPWYRIIGGSDNSSASSYANPSLICPNDNNGGKLSKFTVNDTINGNGDLTYKVGLLTADEVAFAGLMYYNGKNTSMYLHENSSGTWRLISAVSGGKYPKILVADTTNYGIFPDSADIGRSIRPAISLLSNLEITGSGTSEDPYVVN